MTEEEIAAIQAAAAQLGLELVEEARAAAQRSYDAERIERWRQADWDENTSEGV